MKKYNKPLLALLIGTMTVIGAAGVAGARWGGHGGGCGYGYNGGNAPSKQITPEMQQMMEKAYNTIAPMQMELRAKQTELTAKIYGGADDATIQALTKEVDRLQSRVTEARVTMQKEFAKAGMPLHQGGGCMSGGMGMHGGGYHGGMEHGS